MKYRDKGIVEWGRERDLEKELFDAHRVECVCGSVSGVTFFVG